MEFVDKNFGRVLLLEEHDCIAGTYCGGHSDRMEKCDIVAMRNLDTKKVTIFKSRNTSSEDCRVKQFVLNWGIEQKVFEPIKSRFEILDL